MYKLYVPNDRTTLRVFPSLAREIGFNESILLLQIEHWQERSTTKPIKGKQWMYKSLDDMRKEAFPFWSKAKIGRVVKSLEEKKLIEIGVFNKHKYDRTQWFTLNYESLGKLSNLAVVNLPSQNETGFSQNETHSMQNETGFLQNETPIPEIPTETTTEKKDHTVENHAKLARLILNRWNKKSIIRIMPNSLLVSQIETTVKTYGYRPLCYAIENIHSDKWSRENNAISIARLIGKKRDNNLPSLGIFPQSWRRKHESAPTMDGASHMEGII